MTNLITRRGWIAGLAASIAAPPIVRASSLMPLRGAPLSTSGGLIRGGLSYEMFMRDFLAELSVQGSYSELSARQLRYGFGIGGLSDTAPAQEEA